MHANAQGTSHRCNFVATDIFTGKKLEDIVPSTHGTTVPNVFRSEYTLLDITDEDYLSLMDEGGETREDLKMPERAPRSSSSRSARASTPATRSSSPS